MRAATPNKSAVHGGKPLLAPLLPLVAILVLALASCAVGDSEERTEGREMTAKNGSEGPRTLEVRRIDSGDAGRGEARARIVFASSPEDLPVEIPTLRGAERTAQDNATYLAVLWGRKNTGGYAVEVESARLDAERITVVLSLRSPSEDAMVSQAITYPYDVARIGNLDPSEPSERELVFVDRDGRELDWPVELRTGG